MNALLMVPSFCGHRFGKQWKKNPTVTPPLGVLYVGGALERAGFQVRLLDMNVERTEREEFCALVRSADLAAISVMSANRRGAQELVDDVRAIKPAIKIICGGPHINCTMQPFPGADATFMGEGESTAGEICRHLVRGSLTSLRAFAGLYYRDGNEMVKTGPPVVIHDLNRSPGPARHLIDPARYGELFGLRVSRRIAAIDTSRGCPYKCNFCVRRGVFRYRHRDPAEVVDEIEQIVAAGHDLLIFNEDNFTVLPQRAIAILRDIKRRGLKIRIMMQVRVDSATQEFMAACKEAGVWVLILGIESGSQSVLDYYDKGTTVQQGRDAIQSAERLGIFTYGFFILGAPPERDRHFRENIRFFTSVPLDFVGFNILDYQAGSRMWAKQVREGRIHPEEVVVPTGPRFGALPYSEIEHCLRRSYRAFYLRPGLYWRLLKKCWRSRDFTLLVFLMRFSLKLLSRFRPFALAEELPDRVLAEVQP